MKKLEISLMISLFIGISSGIAQTNYIEEVGTIQDNPTVFGIGLKGHYLYVNPGSSQINIYDISDPENPISSGQISYASNFATDLDILGNYLYIYGGPENNLIIFDISNPISPMELGTLQLPSSNTGIWHSGHLPNYSYMTAMDTIYIINTEDKNNPIVENKVTYSEIGDYGLREIFVSTEVLYIGIENGILIYDNSNPELPVFNSLYENGNLSLSVDTINNRLFTAQESGSDKNHYVSNINDPFSPDLIFQGSGGSAPWGKLLVSNNMLIQTGSDNGNQAVSIYKVQGDSTVYLEDFLGSIEYSITDLDAIDSLFVISRNGGIQILKFNGSFTTDIENLLQNSSIEFYPNPTSEILTISIKDNYKTILVKIIDFQGKTIINKEIESNIEDINLTNFDSGLYIVEFVQNGEIIMTKKLMKK